MKPHEDNVVTVAMMVGGFEDAADRLEVASAPNDPSSTFCPLFEALNWAVALDDRIGVLWVPQGQPLGLEWRSRAPDANVMAGVRFARNRVHHNWADAVEVRQGFGFPLRLPMALATWLWREIESVPPDRPDPLGEQVYRDELQGRPVNESLVKLRGAFRFVVGLLGPALQRATSDIAES